MNRPDTAPEREALADRLAAQGHLRSRAWRAAVEAVPREHFLSTGVFLPDEANGLWRPVLPGSVSPQEWVEIVYSDQSLVTQLDGCLTPDQVIEPVRGFPTSSSTVPATVVGMLEDLDVHDGQNVAEIGTGTGYSTALMCHRLGEDNVTSIEVDAEVAARADDALEKAGFSTWTVTGDGLLGNPRRAPFDRLIATCAVRRIPYTWVRQTRPGGVILATVGPGAWSYGTGLAKLTVREDGTAQGQIIGRSSFMPARAEAAVPLSGDLAARAAYADTERTTALSPAVLEQWMPAFLAQLAAPGAQFVHARSGDGRETTYLFDTHRESFAALSKGGELWTVRQGGPIAIWDAIEAAVTAWQRVGEPDVDAVRLTVTAKAHTYSIGGNPTLRWEHRID
ncbi:ATP-grasp peptide maturase system methyltransferase [Yinghuangia sp. ASG 101]|uniref:ATP-grasp peptide maturase system methyltransferase n=1 Tax=Yinghuangia sp. ASG 101 TaxID=2896848 RepID=UPI001E318826|nr:ATP-grasp peptide maturase system methyltransferase [Yinghuangia sp. ASG 101]UGQ14191.1 ATP-grasp peptide maturase system methyltransferase [Yinghuangia sp. ASG 101]